MHSKRLTILLPLMVVLTMLASLITPSPVLAAGEPPPPPGEKSPKAPAAAPAKPAPPASPAGASYTAEIPVDAPLGAPDGAANSAAIALSVDAIAQADAVLVGPSGNPLPLAAQETAGVLAIGDVYFKGSGSGCSGGWCDYDSITNALAAFSSRNGSGTIYAVGSLNELTAVKVDGGTLSLGKLTGLAWDGTTNYTPRITGGLLTIQNMLKGFTVDGFAIFKGIDAHDNAGTLRLQNLYVTNPAGRGIEVTNHKGNIDLFNVTVSGAGDDGALLDNTLGTGNVTLLNNTLGTGNVTISNSSFNGNHDFGMQVFTNGSVLLERVDASGNLHHDGANLTLKKGAIVKDSRFDGNQDFSSGLVISGSGALSLQNVETTGNTDDGIFLNVANDITVNGGLFTGNSVYGMRAYTSGGNIILNNIEALGNAYGVWAGNSDSVSAKTVTINNSLFSNASSGDGLYIKSKGNVTLNHIDAELNASNGVSIDNALYDSGSSIYKGSGSVNLLNTLGLNQFIGNGGWGLNVYSKGAITVKGAYALGNYSGLNLDGCAMNGGPPLTTHNCLGKGNVTVSAVQVGYTSASGGLYVLAGGTISLDGSSFNANDYDVFLNNYWTAAKPVTITHSSFNNTSGPASVGLWVYSRGNITLNNVQANFNNGKINYGPMFENVSGILLDNCLFDINTDICTGSGTVSVLSSLGPSKALGNGQGDGLFIFSKGAITVSGFSSTNNGGGAYIDNLPGTGALTLTNDTFSNNTGNQGGLRAYSTKAITLTGVEASQNSGGEGAMVANTYGLTTTDTVTISKSHFDHNNKDFGLVVEAKGNLTLNNVSANLNNATVSSYGASLMAINGGVTILDTLGPNQFSFNGNTGLYVAVGKGAISVSGVTASSNGWGGIRLDNSGPAATKTVTAQKILAEHNSASGLAIMSKGGVTLNGVQANFNGGGYGVYIDNCLLVVNCTGSGNVSLLSTLGPNSMSSNMVGLRIDSAGSVLVNGTTASNNNGSLNIVSGVWIQNYYTPGKTVIVNQGNFNANAATGLYIKTAGVITLNNIGASGNLGSNGNGLDLRNDGTAGSPGINILSTSGINQTNGNSRVGLLISSSGNIVLNKVIASDNGAIGPQSGAFLNIFGAGSSVTIICSAFNHNGNYGLEVSMGTGTLSFKSVAAGGNLGPAQFNLSKAPVMSWTVCGH
jgi:hypothetical protein